MPDVHAKLSASGASRWMACPPSADLEKQFPDLRRKVMGALQRADIDGWGKHK